MFRGQVHFTVNGQFHDLSGEGAFAPLSDTLRYRLRKTGTKVVCAEGDCGACTVLLARVGDSGVLDFQSINSCIFPSFSADGCHLVTVEGLASGEVLHEIQKSMARNFGGQCGFCTPGFVMSLVNMFERKAKPSEQNIKNYLTGNLCRCTGYQPILQAAQDVDMQNVKPVREMYPLQVETEQLRAKTTSSLMIEAGARTLFAPRTLAEAVKFRGENPKARIFSGATDIGVQINKGKYPGDKQMSLHLLVGLNRLELDSGFVHVGARVTLDRLQNFCQTHAPAFAEFLNIFASPQIKNSATLAGNLANGSPIADTTPFLLAVDAQIELTGSKGTRLVPLNGFFVGYKKFNKSEEEFITAVRFITPKTSRLKIGLYKVSQRRDLDISCVNSCFIVHEQDGKIASAKIAFGGVGPVAVRLFELENKITGQTLDRALVDAVAAEIGQTVQPISDVRGSGVFRKRMAQQLFKKFAREHLGL